jgi:hypothetical protein
MHGKCWLHSFGKGEHEKKTGLFTTSKNRSSTEMSEFKYQLHSLLLFMVVW